MLCSTIVPERQSLGNNNQLLDQTSTFYNRKEKGASLPQMKLYCSSPDTYRSVESRKCSSNVVLSAWNKRLLVSRATNLWSTFVDLSNLSKDLKRFNIYCISFIGRLRRQNTVTLQNVFVRLSQLEAKPVGIFTVLLIHHWLVWKYT